MTLLSMTFKRSPWFTALLGTTLAFGLNTTAADAALLVGNTAGNDIRVIDEVTGRFGATFVPADFGLDSPDALVYGPDGNLYVSSGTTRENSAIYRFNGRTGEFIDIFAQGGGLLRPYGMAFGPDGNLYVSSFRTDEILRFDGTTGEFLDVFAAGTGEADGLNGPNGLLFGPDGALYVTTQGSVADGTGGISFEFGFDSQVLRYDLETGVGSVFIEQPEAGEFGFVSLLGLAIGPEGDLYVSDFANGVQRYDFLTGTLIEDFSAAFPGAAERSNRTGAIAFDPSGNFYTVGFDFNNGNAGAVLKYDGSSSTPTLLTGPTASLERPIGVTYAPFQVPEPTAIGGLVLVGLAAAWQRSRR